MTRAEPQQRSSWTSRIAASLLSLFVIVLWPVQSSAQSNVDGYVFGTGKPGAAVTITGVETGQTFRATVDESGNFRIGSVPTGRYSIAHEGVSENITVRVGEGTEVAFGGAAGATQLETLQVTGAAVAPIDVSQTEVSFNIGETQFDSIPVPRSITGIALLSPGSIQGDNGFGTLASIGGSTVSENQYYLNGYNISDLRTRLGPSTVPFEFFKEMQVKTAGYGAEFGRSTGGVVNAVSKRGSNNWESGFNLFFNDDSWTEKKPDTVETLTSTGFPYAYYFGDDQSQTQQMNMFLGGPIVKDRLFMYVLANLRTFERERVRYEGAYFRDFQKGRFFDRDREEDPFGALKLDWQIASGHNLEFTAFADRTRRLVSRFNYDRVLTSPADPTGDNTIRFGGTTVFGRYVGHITDMLKVSTLIGRGTADTSQIPSASDCPSVNDTVNNVSRGCFVGNSILSKDTREQFRLDFELALGDLGAFGNHTLKFGIDRENNESADATALSGGFTYDLLNVANAGDPIGQSGVTAPAAGDYVVVTNFYNQGVLEEELNAYYLEDTWRIVPSVTATIGLRLETFENINTIGQTFVDLEGDVAPRLGVAWDILDDSTMKLYANYGRYYIPIGTQASVRNGTGEYYVAEAYEWDGTFSADKTERPGLGAFVGDRVTANGEVTDPRVLVGAEVEPSYQDEYMVGFQTALPESIFGTKAVGGIRYIYRELGVTLEDIAIDVGLNALAVANPGDYELSDCDDDGVDDDFACGFDFYFITNPGSGSYSVYLPVNQNGDFINTHDPAPQPGTETVVDYRQISVPNDVMGYPEPERYYHAVELTYEKTFGPTWFMQGSYTWSQSYGNYEGFVNSTIEQDDVAITQDFDQPGLLDGAYGWLANDRRHKFKLFGAYNMLEELQLGANFYWQSGRPLSALGFHPTDPYAGAYAQFSHYTTHPEYSPDGSSVLVQRGHAGRTPNLWSFDLLLNYTPTAFQKKLKFGIDVFNLFNNDKATEQLEVSERLNGAVNPRHKLPTDYQEPRSLRMRLEYEFGN